MLQMLQMIPGLERHGESISAKLCVHFVGGGLAGITAATVTYPLDLVRTRLSAQVKINYLLVVTVQCIIYLLW